MALQSFSEIYWRFSWGFREFVTVGGRKGVKDGLSQGLPDPNACQAGNENTVVGHAPCHMGSGNTIVNDADTNKSVIHSQGGTAIGRGACADSTSVAIGASANAGACASQKKP